MAGRHRRTPAWRRLLLRLRRSDRAARTAALQAEAVALRATVCALRAELDQVWESAAAATAAAREASRRQLRLPLVAAAVAPPEGAETRVAAAATPALAGVTSIVLDLRPATAMTEIVLVEQPDIVLVDLPEIVLADPAEIVLADPAEIVLADLPESALLDPKQARDAEVVDVSEPATASAPDTVLPARRTA